MVLLGGAFPQIVELLQNLWSNGPLSATVPYFWDTVPQIVELFHKNGTSTLCRSFWILSLFVGRCIATAVVVR